MKLTYLALTLPLAFSAPVFLGADEHANQEDAGEHSEDSLHEQMEQLQQAMGKLRRAMRDESQLPAALEALTEMQTAIVLSKAQVPDSAKAIAEGDRARYVAGYRKMLIELCTKTLALESALIDRNKDAAKTLFREIRGMEETGHDKYQGEEQ